mgnify:CR=1 FL=1
MEAVRASAVGVGETIPMCALVIPGDGVGSVEIKLESSTDMISWNAANPGLYGGSAEKR